MKNLRFIWQFADSPCKLRHGDKGHVIQVLPGISSRGDKAEDPHQNKEGMSSLCLVCRTLKKASRKWVSIGLKCHVSIFLS